MYVTPMICTALCRPYRQWREGDWKPVGAKPTCFSTGALTTGFKISPYQCFYSGIHFCTLSSIELEISHVSRGHAGNIIGRKLGTISFFSCNMAPTWAVYCFLNFNRDMGAKPIHVTFYSCYSALATHCHTGMQAYWTTAAYFIANRSQYYGLLRKFFSNSICCQLLRTLTKYLCGPTF